MYSSNGGELAHLALDAVVIVSETSVQTIRHILRPGKVGRKEPFYVTIWLSSVEIEPRVSKASNAYGGEYLYVAYLGIRDRHRDNVRAFQRQTPRLRKNAEGRNLAGDTYTFPDCLSLRSHPLDISESGYQQFGPVKGKIICHPMLPRGM